jgi:Glyoxalase-like domain
VVREADGVKAAVGGSHPGRGTRNALASLGGRRYLEIIAPDPRQTAYDFHPDLRELGGPRLVTWAALTTDIAATAERARRAGLQVFGPTDGSRARPDGKLLRWKTLAVQTGFGAQGVEPVPFFIEWAGDSPHPSQDSPRGCELLSFELGHPEPAGLIGVLRKLGIGAEVRGAEEARLRATLKTPKGEVVLG